MRAFVSMRHILKDRIEYKKELYHSEASFKDIGKYCFSINKIEDEELIKELLSKLNEKIN